MVFLPIYSSVLSPVERLWSMVKVEWKKRIAKLKYIYNQDNMTADVNKVMQYVAPRANASNIMDSADPYLFRIA